MKRVRITLTVVLAVALVAGVVHAQNEAPANVQVSVDGNPVSFSEPLLMVDMQYPLLPAQTYLEALGASADWNAGSQRLDVRLGDTQMQMWVDRNWVTVNGARRDMQPGLHTLSDIPYVPGASTAELLGLSARWDPATLQLSVASPTTMPQGPTVAATLLEVRTDGQGSLVVRVNETGEVDELPLSPDLVVRRGAADDTPAPARLADLQPGDRVEIVFNQERTAVGIAASYTQTLGTIASIQGNQLTLQGGQTYPLGEGVQAFGSNGDSLHLLAAVGQGAILTMNPDSSAVWRILAQRSGTATPPDSAQPVIAAHIVPRYDSPLGEGGSLQIRIVGSAGAAATVQLGTSGQAVTVPEDAPGVYAGAMTIPAGLIVPGEDLVAQLEAGGAASQQVPSNRAVTIDAEAPTFTELVPADQATIADANTHIVAHWQDGQGVGVDPATATLSVDGAEVTGQAQVDAGQILYDTPDALAAGQHQATVSVADALGNTATRTWTWTIQQAQRGILNVSHDAQAPLQPGDTVTVTIEVAEPGQAASFTIEGLVQNVTMNRVGETNNYRGSYTIGQQDAATNATVSASFTAADGTQYQANAPAQITIAAPQVEFAITTPTDGAETGRKIEPAGTAPAGSTVRYTITYEEFILAGEVAAGTAEADAAGNWQGEEVDLKLLLIGMADQYNMTAELLNDQGAVQETKTVSFTAKG